MKFSKRVLSLLLVIVMVLGMIPVTVQAETEEPTVSTESSSVSVEGTNSFGNLLSDAIAEAEEESEDDYTGQYSVTDLTISGNVATVTYDAMEEATLVVAIYSEDGMQLITSGKTTVSPDQTVAEVTIEGEMPEFFEAAAYLLDTYDYSPLCDAYTSPMYTQEMQQLLNSTVNDYDPELVLNLDEDETTNFAVYNPSVVRIDPVEGMNTMASIDHENGIFVIENADAQITSLTAGTIFTYAWAEDELLIARVGQILIDGTTVTITGAELKIEEVFDHLKLETAGDSSRMEYDGTGCGEGITFQGFVEESEKPATRAWEGDVTLKKKSLSFKISLESQDDSSLDDVEVSFKGSVSGDLTLTAYPKLEYYLSLKKQHISITADLVGDLNVSFEGTLSESLSLGKPTFPSPVSGITFTAEPKLVLSFKMSAVLHVVMTTQVGFGYSSSDGVQNLCTKPKLEMDSYVEGTLFFGIEFEISTNIINKDIASAGFTILGGVQLTARPTGTAHESPPRDTAPKKHTCEECIDMKVDQVREFSIWAKLLKYIKIEKTIKKTVNHLFDMYWSRVSDNPGSGFGKCPNYVYRVTVKVQDKAGNPALDQEIFLKDGDSLGKTNEKGTLAVYVSPDEYTFQTTIGEETLSVTRNVKNATKVVLTNNPEILRKLALYDSLLMNSINITTHDTYGQGVFSSGVTWKLYRSGQMIISGEGAMDNYSSYSKVPWCNLSDKIKEVEIKDGVTNVSSYAFSGCTNIKTVILADSVTTIGNYAFRRCYGLREIRLPVDYTCQQYSFSEATGIEKVQYGCGKTGIMLDRSSSTYGYSLEYNSRNALQTVIFEEGITNVANYAFYSSAALRNVYFAETITEIGQYAFYDSGVLTIELPESMAKIGYKAFESSDLTEIYFPDSLESINGYAFKNCVNLSELVIPNHLGGHIGGSAFSSCTGLKHITLPVDYQQNGTGIFMGCTNVESIFYTPGATGAMPNRTGFDYTATNDLYYQTTLEYACRNALKSLIFDEGVTSIGYCTYYGGTPVLEYVELPSTLESIGERSFYQTSLTHIELPEGLKLIDYKAFYDSALTEIWFPDSLEDIRNEAFYSSALSEIRFPESMDYIGYNAFQYCTNLTELVLPDQISSYIGGNAFSYCTNLKRITLPVDYQRGGTGIFTGCINVESIHYTPGTTGVMPDRTGFDYTATDDIYYETTLEYICRNALKSVVFDEGITQIGNYAYYGGTPVLQHVELPFTLESIGYYTFYNTGLTSIELPESLISIDSYAFSGSKLTEIWFPDSLETIGYQSFYESALTEIRFPDSLKTIGNQAFQNCANLTELVIPNHMGGYLGGHAFSGCTGLKKVTLPVDYQQYDTGIFMGCTNVESIHYTPGATGIMTDRSIADYTAVSKEVPYEYTLEYACRNSLKTITFGEGIKRIGIYVYYGGTPVLQHMELPSTLESIGSYAFYGTTLTSIRFPEGLVNIDPLAFQDSKLTSISFTGDAPVINWYAFGNVTATAYYPSGNETWTADMLQNYGGTLTWVESDTIEGEPTEPEETEPAPTEPEATEPEATEPEATEPETTEPEITEPASTEPETTEPAQTEPEATEPEETQPLANNLSLQYNYGNASIIQVKTNLPASTPCVSFLTTDNGSSIDESANLYQQIGWIGMSNADGIIYLNFNFNSNFSDGQTYVLPAGAVFGFTDGNLYTLDKDYTFTFDGTQWTMTATESTETLAVKKKPASRAVFGGEYTSVELDNRTVHTARFSELVPGESYVLIAVLDIEAEDLLAPGNLLAIRQDIAAEDGTLVFDYVQKQQADVSYVFAAGPSNQNLEDAQITFPVMTANGDVQTIEPVVTYNGKVLSEEADYILVGEVDYSEPGEYTCYVRGVRQYTGLVKCVYTVKEMEMAGWSLSLGDSIGVNFYVTVGDNLINDAVVKITVDGETTAHPVANALKDPTTGSYVFTAQVAAAQMTAPVTVELIVEGKTISTKTYTVRQYAEYILDESNGYDAATVSLVTEMLRYGAAAQLYFDCNTDNLANAGYDTELSVAMPSEAPAVVKKGVVPGVAFYGASLLFREQVMVRYYFKLSKDVDAYTFHAGDTVCTAVAKDGLYYVDVPGINPQNLDQPVNLTVHYADFSLTVGYSPLHYIIRMYHKAENPQTLKELLLAMYSYHTVAKSYAN